MVDTFFLITTKPDLALTTAPKGLYNAFVPRSDNDDELGGDPYPNEMVFNDYQ